MRPLRSHSRSAVKGSLAAHVAGAKLPGPRGAEPAGTAGLIDTTRSMRYMYLMAVSLRLPADVEARLDNLARRTGRTKSFYIREAVLEHLDDLEDLFLAEERLRDVLSGRSDTVPLEDLLKQHGLAD